MRYFITALLFFVVQGIRAQSAPALPDSLLKEFSRLTCECATLMKIDEGDPKKASANLGTCIRSTLGVFVQNDWFKKEWLDDSVWVDHFYSGLEKELTAHCPAFAAFLKNADQKAPEPLSSVPPAYFLSDAFMTARKLQLNPNATTSAMKRWSAKDMGNASIQMVFDIRFVFNTEQEAADYLRIKAAELSEGGTTLNKDLQALGANESAVYGENPNMNGIFGDLDMKQYNFVFRVGKVVAKVFVSTSKKATYEDALAFAKQAIAILKKQ